MTDGSSPRLAVVVGTGAIARRHARNLRALVPGAHLLMVRRPTSETPEEALAPLADEVLTSVEEAVDRAPDLAVVAGPASHREAQATALAAGGAHLFLEKPLATDATSGARLRSRLAAARVTVAVGYDLRHHPAVQALKAAIDDGLVGRLLGVRAEVGQHLASWRPGIDHRRSVSARRELGGGALLELSHEVDYVRWLAGDIRDVAAAGGSTGAAGTEVEDHVDLLLTHRSGVHSAVHLDMVDRWPGRRCRVVGTEGTLVWDSTTGAVQAVVGDAPPATLLTTTPADMDQVYVTELAAFLDRCVSGDRGLTDLDDAVAVLEVLDAARARLDDLQDARG